MTKGQEVNLKILLRKIYRHRFVFLASLGGFLMLAFIYIVLATPIYEVSTSLLIDSSGSNRTLGESQYVEGGVSLIEMEKNLYNEIGIIKSFSLINQTLEDLDLDITYRTEGFLGDEEHYGYFPFQVELDRRHSQSYGLSFEIKPVAGNRFSLSVEGEDFMVSNPLNGTKRKVERDFEFSEIYKFGEPVKHEYFSFTLVKPDYPVNIEDFEKADLYFVINDIEKVTKDYMSKIEVNNIDIQASIFKIVSSGPLVAKEKAFLKKLSENYVQNSLQDRNNIASGKESFIEEQLRIISDSLSTVEMNLESFRKDADAVDLSTSATNALDQTQEFQVEKAKVQLDIKYYNSLIQDIENNRANQDYIVPSATGIEDPLITENMKELQRLYSERSKKKFFVTSDNQEMRILNRQVAEATDLLLDNLRNAVRSARFDMQRVNSQLSRFDDEISSLPTRENQLMTIKRKSALYENLFNYLSQELAKTGIARAERTSDTRVLDEARMVGDGPVAPQKPLLMVLATTLGLLLPLGWMVFFASDDAIENIDQITANTDIPVIASIVMHEGMNKSTPEKNWKDPLGGLRKFRSNGINGSASTSGRVAGPKQDDPHTYAETSKAKLFRQKVVKIFNRLGKALGQLGILNEGTEVDKEASEVSLWRLKESFRFLSTNLKTVSREGKGVIGISSILPEEGKTFISINLGITLAEAGYKTLIIDTDLRKPGLIDKTQKIKDKGLWNYLSGDIAEVHEIIHAYQDSDNLDFIPTSVVEGNVHRLLSDPRMGRLIDQVKKEYDFVILDTPAAGLVSDFLLLSHFIDANLFIIRRNVAKMEFLHDIEKLVPKGKKNNSYIVFNGTEGSEQRYGFEEKYGHNEEEQLVRESLSV